MLLTRALPGSVAVVAALTIPEFSVGAGDLDGGKRRDKPIEPDATTGRAGVKRTADAASNPLAGVRYGGQLVIPDARARAGAIPRIGGADFPNASLAIQPPLPVLSEARQALDAAASYSISVLDRFASPSDALSESSVAGELAAERPKTAAVNPLDVAVGYAASTIERFVAAPVEEPAFAAGALLVVELAPSSASSLPPGVTPGDTTETARPEDLVAELVTPPVPAGITGKPGLVPPRADPVPAAAPLPQAAPRSAIAQIAALPPSPSTPAVQPARSAAAASQLAAPLAASSASFAFDIKSQLVTRVDGKAAGTVDFQQTATGLSVRLGSIAAVLGDRFAAAEIARIQSSAASNAYLSLAELQAQGIPISYDPVYDEFNVGTTDTRPKAARKVHMDQISAPERGLGTAVIDQVRR